MPFPNRFRRLSAATIKPVPLHLSTPVKFVKRIGDRIAAGLAERGIHTIEDLLYHLPFRYEDRLHPKPLSLYNPGDMASLIGEVRGTALLRTRSGPIFEMTVGITPPDPNSNAAMQGLLAPPPAFSSRNPAPRSSFASSPSAPPQIRYPEASASGLIGSKRIEGVLTPTPILETIKCMWFHGTYLKDKFHAGQKIALYGKLEGSRSGNALGAIPGSTRFKMIQPTFEILPDSTATGEDAEFILLEMGRIVPVYESLGGKTPWGSKLTSRWTRRILWTIFKDLAESDSYAPSPPSPQTPGAPFMATAPSSPWVGVNEARTPTRSPSLDAQSDETLPTSLRNRLNFPTRMAALRDLHFPPAGTSMTELMSARTPAHRRLIFEEFFYLELGLELKRRKLRNRQGTAFVTNDQVREALKQILPFKPTAAQKRVLGEIVTDMRRTQPMRRLLQGDVGSGKTIVAFQAALVAIENGYQVALMAPTEILATQHYLSARKLLSEKISPRTKRPYRIGLLTGSLDDKTKRDTRNRIFRGEIDLAIGTHALVEEKVDFANLGLVIVDEQHRFGVQQRFQLMRKPNTGAATQRLSESPQPMGAPSIPTAPSSGWVGVNQSNTSTRSNSPALQKSVILSERSEPKDLPARSQQQASSSVSGRRSPSPSTQDSSRPEDTTQTSSSRPEAEGRSGETPVLSSPHNPNPATRSPSPSAQDRSLPPDAQSEPDVLVMTATPIPRTLALTLYGDLEASVIDELPPGRTPIQTRRMPEERSSEVWDFIRKQVAAGRQAYIVYPIIEGATDDQPELDFAKTDDTIASASLGLEGGFSPLSKPAAKKGFSPGSSNAERPSPKTAKTKRVSTTKLRSATDMHHDLQQGPLAGLRLGLLHGRMSADDKEVTMARFKRNELDVLVSTTVIEVGVDVPNATVMVIEHADRFGLAQLHQLRGRVGRGAAKSFCILVTAATVTPEADLRLNAMVQTQDGFALAELDLQQRGPGEFFGTKQAGLPEFRVANLARDRDLLELARQEAAHFAEQEDPTMPRPEIDAVWSRLKQQWQRRYGLVEA
ncbi:MAG: helicase-related protein [Acidobacteriaceae bacterium]